MNCSGNYNDEPRGAILVMVAIVLVALFGFLAFGIDIVRLHGASSEQLFTADHLALGALQVYLDYEPTPGEIGPPPAGLTAAQIDSWARLRRHQIKYDKAYDRVLQLGSLNSFVGRYGEQFIRTASELGSGAGAEGSPNYRAALVAGRWWTKRPDSCDNDGRPAFFDNCPCAIDNAAIPDPQPCFQLCDPASGGCMNLDGTFDPPYASAFRVTLQTRPGEGIQNVAAGVLGAPESRSHGTSTSGGGGSVAAALPKADVLMLDLGRPTEIDGNNYLPFERGNPAAREYSYRLTGRPSGCGGNGAQTTLSSAGDLSLIWEPASSSEAGYQASYTALSVAQKAQYFCYEVPVNGATEFHLVATGGPEPQPLTNLMRATHATLLQARKAALGADRFALLGYDERHISDRFLAFTDVNSPDYDKMLSITDVDSPGGRVEAAKAGFFPMSAAKSDIGGGLLESYKRLNIAMKLYRVDPLITIISNGLTECERVSIPGTVTCTRYGRVTPPDTFADLNDIYSTHRLALSEITDVIIPNKLKPNGIKLEVVTAGEKTLAHSVLIRDTADPSTCLTDIGLRQHGYMDVVGGLVPAQYQNAYLTLGDTAGGSYVQPAVYLYSMAMQGQGEYFPWRPRCQDVFGSTAYLGPYLSLDALCQTGSLAPPPNGRDAQLNTESRLIKDGGVPNIVLDPDGRLLCSPSSKTPSESLDIVTTNTIETRSSFLVSEFR